MPEILKTFLQLTLRTGIFCVIILILPYLPPDIKFEAYSLAPIRVPVSPSYVLDRAELFSEGVVKGGAESYDYPPNSPNNDVYASTLDGWIIRVNDLGNVEKLAQIRDDDGRVGVPLGIQFTHNSSQLIMADLQLGLVQFDIESKLQVILLKTGRMVDNQEINTLNDLAVSSDGIIYFSQPTKWTSMRHIYEMLGEPTGRLLQYNPRSDEVKVLLDSIHYANGVILSQDEGFILVSELMRCRILKYYLKGERVGTREVFIDGLEGYPDNMCHNGRGGFYISLFMARDEKTEPLETLASLPLLRKLLCRLYEVILVISETELWMGIVPKSYQTTLSNLFMRFFTPFLDLGQIKSKVIIFEVDSNGKILKNFQNKILTAMSGISELTMNGRSPWAYLGAPLTDQLWRIQTKHLK